MPSINVPQVALNTGKFMPIIGLGTWKSKPGEVVEAVKNAIDCGYRHIDCAHVYENEPEVGVALKEKFQEGVVKREEIFITSKLWNTYHSKSLVKPALEVTLKNLGLSYVDMYLIHWPMGYEEGKELFPKNENGKASYSNVDFVETWLGMEACFREGLTKAIGVSNFSKDQIERILSAGSVVPATNQVECHPYLTQKKLMEYCKSKDIALTAYSPLGSPDRPWAKSGDPLLMEEAKIVEIGKKHHKTPAQILIRYQIQRGNICIPKSVTKERIISNFQVFDFELSSDEMTAIDSFERNGRLLHLDWVKDHPYYPFHTEY